MNGIRQRQLLRLTLIVLFTALIMSMATWLLFKYIGQPDAIGGFLLIASLIQCMVFWIVVYLGRDHIFVKDDQKYRQLTEDLRNVVFRIRYPEREYDFVNQAARDILGYEPDDFYEDPHIWEKLILAEWHEALFNFRKGLEEGLEPETIEYQVRTKDGSIKWLSQHNSYIKDKNGNLAALEGTLIDISRQKSVSANVQAAYQRVQVLNARLTAQTKALDQSAIVARTDTDGIITYCNDKITETSGYDITELIGNNYSMLKSGLHSDDFFRKMWETIKKGEIWRGEICNKTKHGELYWVDAVITPIRDEEDQIRQYITIRFDITSKKKAEKILQVQNENITASLNYAKRIQEATLPENTEIKKWIPNSFVFFKPRDIVSGDFYWFEEKIGKKYVAAVDCTGHGVPGAFMSLLGSGIMDKLVNSQHILEIDRLAEFMHLEVRKLLHQENSVNQDGMDMQIISIDQRKKSLEFVGVKNPLVYFQNGQMHIVRGNKLPIGGGERYGATRKFAKETISIEEPTTVYLFSDGYIDQFGGENRRKMMSKRFYELLTEIHQLPFEEQEARLEAYLSRWQGNLRQVDDILVIGMQVS